jgi:hypothetical protein
MRPALKFGARAAVFIAAFGASPAHAGTWVISTTPTNSVSNSHTAGGQANSIARSDRLSATLITSITAPTGGTIFAEARAVYSGSWVFQWQPSGPNDWPGAYTIKSIKQRNRQVIVQGGTGTGSVSVTGGATLVSAALPNGGSQVTNFPAPTVSVDTSVPNLTVTTRSTEFRATRSEMGKMSDAFGANVIVERAYQAQWFVSNFATPGDVQLTFPVEAVDWTARLDFSSTGSDVVATAIASASDLFIGQ